MDEAEAPTTYLMLIVPHPDDEVFGLGGTLLRCAAAGRRTAVLTLTRGGSGRSLGLVPQERVAEQREQELRASAAELGVNDLVVRDHRDFVTSRDRGLEPHPGLAGEPPEALAQEVRAEIERLRPQVIVTFAPNGSNGHPDHVATSRAVQRALEFGAPRPARLYWYAAEHPFAGPERPGFLAPDLIREGFVRPTHVVELSREELEGKLRAMSCHRTQALSVLTFMQRITRRLFLESFHRVDPPADGETPRTVRWL